MLPFARRDFQANILFQDDNGPAHRGRRDENMQHMDWLAMSSNLNQIENLWSEISRGLNKMDTPLPPTNGAELTQAVVDIWRNIPDQKLSILVLSHTKYWILFSLAWLISFNTRTNILNMDLWPLQMFIEDAFEVLFDQWHYNQPTYPARLMLCWNYYVILHQRHDEPSGVSIH